MAHHPLSCHWCPGAQETVPMLHGYTSASWAGLLPATLLARECHLAAHHSPTWRGAPPLHEPLDGPPGTWCSTARHHLARGCRGTHPGACACAQSCTLRVQQIIRVDSRLRRPLACSCGPHIDCAGQTHPLLRRRGDALAQALLRCSEDAKTPHAFKGTEQTPGLKPACCWWCHATWWRLCSTGMQNVKLLGRGRAASWYHLCRPRTTFMTALPLPGSASRSFSQPEQVPSPRAPPGSGRAHASSSSQCPSGSCWS